MRRRTKYSTWTRNYCIDFFLILLIVFAFAASLLWLRLDVTLTLVLLVGVWLLDGYLKKTYGFGNETLFADLSFSALVFAGSQGIELVTVPTPLSLNRMSLPRLAVIMFVLSILWIGNLSISRGLAEETDQCPDNVKARRWIWVASFLLAMLSTCSILVSQVVGLL
jgi:hypothetical protein